MVKQVSQKQIREELEDTYNDNSEERISRYNQCQRSVEYLREQQKRMQSTA